MDKICYWDEVAREMREREATEAEQLEIDALRAAAGVAAVPQQVTRRQAMSALLLAGALDNVQPCIDAIPDPIQRRLAQIEYDESQTFERNRPLVVSIGAALGLDLDALFTTAATL